MQIQRRVGNFRFPQAKSLKNVADRFVLSNELSDIVFLPRAGDYTATQAFSLPRRVEQFEKLLIEQALKSHAGNVQRTCEALDLPRKYRTIIVPSSSFQLVTDLAKARSALARFYDHLLPGGTLVTSIWHIGDVGDGEWGD